MQNANLKTQNDKEKFKTKTLFPKKEKYKRT